MGHNLQVMYIEYGKDRHFDCWAFFAQLIWTKYVKKYSGMYGSDQRPLAVFCEGDDELWNSIKCRGNVQTIRGPVRFSETTLLYAVKTASGLQG
jgi:hypothetical protein